MSLRGSVRCVGAGGISMSSSDPAPHEDTGYDANTSLIITLVGLALIFGLFVTPFFFDNGWKVIDPGTKSYARVAVRVPAPARLRQSAQQEYRDPLPLYDFGTDAQSVCITPNMVHLPNLSCVKS